MSIGRSMPATSAIPAEAFAPSPIAFSTIIVVTSELPGTPAPADEATKLAAELFTAEYAAAHGVRVVVNRCGVIAGPWQMGKIDQGLTP